MTNPSDPSLLTQVKQYRFVRQLGRGGMGTVYEAVDNRDEGRVAVKLLHPWLAAEDASFRDRFEREAHIAALLRSPYSVRLLDFGVANGVYFLVMEYVEGTTVGAELEKGPMEPLRALRIAIDVARALEEANARGVVHRDIKPDNILLTDDGRVKVTDFGIARQEGGTGLTSAGRFVGTPEFAAPEQASGEADHRSDVYALGATLYCMLSGHPPFQGTSVWDVLRAHQSSPVSMEPLGHLPDSICNPVRRCLEKDPRDRYQTASELAGALERALANFMQTTQTPGAQRAASAPVPPSAQTPAAPAQAASAPPPPGATRVAPSASAPAPPPAAAGGTRIAAPGSLPAPPSGAQGAAAPASGAVSLSAVPAGMSPAGIAAYDLAIANGTAAPAQLSLSAVDPSGALAFNLPPSVSLAPGETQHLSLQVRAAQPGRPGPVQFQVIAQRADGSRAAFANVVHAGSGAPAKAAGSRAPLIVLGAVVVAAAAVGAFLFLGGGGDDKKASSTATATTAPATSGATQAATTASSPTAAPSTAAGATVQALDRWDYSFTITATTCSFGAKAGERYQVAFRFKPSSGAQQMKDGDQVAVTGLQAQEFPLGSFTFHPVNFEFSYPVAGAGNVRGTATVKTTFANATTIGQASLTEKYDTCAISGTMGGQ